MLSKHPRVEQTLREELWAKVPELMRGEIKMLTIDQTQSLTYLDAVIKETLRLLPPGPLAMRQAERDTHLVDGTFFPKGATVGMSPYVMGRLRSIWGDDSLEFKPDRFIDAATGRSRVVSPYAFFSFSAGPRVCIDKHLAMLQMKLLIATLLSRFRLDMLPNDGSYKIAATMILKNPRAYPPNRGAPPMRPCRSGDIDSLHIGRIQRMSIKPQLAMLVGSSCCTS